MFLEQALANIDLHGFPRIRGDVPLVGLGDVERRRFSPHTRGCSESPPNPALHSHVFPAYAGMFRAGSSGPGGRGGFPRIRGDVPPIVKRRYEQPEFSPHTRGCSSRFDQAKRRAPVFPAYAGMFRIFLFSLRHHQSFPRIRGDVPPALE